MSEFEMETIRIGTLVRAENALEQVQQIASYGFECVALVFHREKMDLSLENLAGEVLQVCKENGMAISSLCLYANPLEESEEGEKAWASLERLIHSARFFETDLIGCWTGRLRNRSIPECIPRFVETWEALGTLAAEMSVRIAFENCLKNGDWHRGDWNIAHNPAAWELMFNALPLDNLGLQWEPCHQMLQLMDPLPQLKKWTARIFNVHGKCCSLHWDVIKDYGIHGEKPYAHQRFPGFGDCDWAEIIRELLLGGFKGSIDIEGWHDPLYRDSSELTGQVAALHYLKQCRELVTV